MAITAAAQAHESTQRLLLSVVEQLEGTVSDAPMSSHGTTLAAFGRVSHIRLSCIRGGALAAPPRNVCLVAQPAHRRGCSRQALQNLAAACPLVVSQGGQGRHLPLRLPLLCLKAPSLTRHRPFADCAISGHRARARHCDGRHTSGNCRGAGVGCKQRAWGDADVRSAQQRVGWGHTVQHRACTRYRLAECERHAFFPNPEMTSCPYPECGWSVDAVPSRCQSCASRASSTELETVTQPRWLILSVQDLDPVAFKTSIWSRSLAAA